jgi:hypothetical protein
MNPKVVVFIHGWSVRNTDSYGKLPERLAAEAQKIGMPIDIQHLYLGKYVSFRDEVRLDDISRALEAALLNEAALQEAINNAWRLVFITHSTGGPVARDWWHRQYLTKKRACPLSHLIMLAPANFGSALAQLGKGKVSRLKNWFEGVEPGQGVLDWLELGSDEAWALNKSWVTQETDWRASPNVYQFVLTGQSIDREFYDHLNSYTDEVGSDGVVRAASANLNATYIKLRQEAPQTGEIRQTALVVEKRAAAPRTAFAVLPGVAHSGKAMGIMRSVAMRDSGKLKPHPTVAAILKCLAVDSDQAYGALCDEFDALTVLTQEAERVEKARELFIVEREFKRPVTTQLIVRVHDQNGYPLKDFDFLLTAWNPNDPNPRLRAPDPNLLPPGFFIDRQRNKRAESTVTYFLNHDVLSKNTKALGIAIRPRPTPDAASGKSARLLVHYLNAVLDIDGDTLLGLVRANATLMVDIEMKRIVRSGVFRLTQDLAPKDFTNDPPGEVLPG